jgi:hypothetical protein
MRRVILLFVSELLACCIVAATGAWQPIAKLLHRWSQGVLIVFLLIFAALMFLALRRKLVESPWMIPICAVLGYLAATLAYVVYFAIFEPQRFLNNLGHSYASDEISVLVFLLPIYSFSWLFGAIVGITFFALNRMLRGELP